MAPNAKCQRVLVLAVWLLLCALQAIRRLPFDSVINRTKLQLILWTFVHYMQPNLQTLRDSSYGIRILCP